MGKQDEFIRIDDVFKSMEGVEEHGQQGSWLKMKELLDKEMPLVSPTATGKNKILRVGIPMLLLLLLLGGGFYLWKSTNNGQSPANTVANNAPKTDLSNTESNKINGNTTKSVNSTPVTVITNQGEKAPKGSDSNSPSLASASGTKHDTRNTHLSKVAGSLVVSSNNQGKVTTTANGNNLVSNKPIKLQEEFSGNSSEANSLDAVMPMSRLASNEVNHKTDRVNLKFKEISIPSNIIALQSSLSVIEEDRIINQIKPAQVNPSSQPSNELSVSKVAEDHQLQKVAKVNNQNVYQDEKGGLYKERKDTLLQVELMRRSPDGKKMGMKRGGQNELIMPHPPTFDTTAEYRIARVSFVPLTRGEIKGIYPQALSANIQPAKTYSSSYSTAITNESNKGNVQLVPLDNFKVSSWTIKKNRVLDWLHSSNGLYGLFDGNKDWYLAFMVGGNTGLGSPSAYGMQLGLAFLYRVGERWSLSMGLRYKNIYYSNFQFLDSALTYQVEGEKVPSGTKYSGLAYDNLMTYRVHNLSGLDVPLLANYDLGRFSVFGGPDFIYYFGLKNTQSEQEDSRTVSKVSYDNENPFINQGYNLNPISDFRPRFGLGYTFGLSYDFSREVSINVRLNQMLWDNIGNYKLDAVRKIYRQPSAEINLGFYLGRREKVLYMMEGENR